MSILYTKIQELCSERNVSIYRMCKDLHMSTRQIYSLKRGEKRKLQPAYAEAIANYFGVPVDFFMDDCLKEAVFISEGTVNSDSVVPVDMNSLLMDSRTEEEIVKACVSLVMLSRKIYSTISSIEKAYPSIYGSDPSRFNDLRGKVLERSKGLCERCGCKNEKLHVHHKNPTGLGFPKICKEEDLFALCSTCHSVVHNNPKNNRKFIININEDDY